MRCCEEIAIYRRLSRLLKESLELLPKGFAPTPAGSAQPRREQELESLSQPILANRPS